MFVVIEQPAYASSTDHRSVSTRKGCAAHDQRIAETLVVALVMTVGTVFLERIAKHPVPHRDQDRHSSRTLRTHRSAKAFKFGDRGDSRITSILSRFTKSRNA